MGRMRWWAAAALAAPVACFAQAFPAKPIRTIIALGGGAEVLARMASDKASASMGVPIVIEAQSAAGGSIGALTVARAAPDGYTILFAATNSQLYHLYLSKTTPYDPVKDFTPITRIGEALLLIVGDPKFAPGTLRELLAYAKANPGKVSYGTSGVGTTHHLSAELIGQLAGVDWVHVPYKGGAQILPDVIAGRIPIAFSILATADTLIRSGKLKVIAINNATRSPSLPGVATITEQLPGYETPPGWMAYFGPANLPRPIVQRLNTELVKALNQPDVKAKGLELGLMVNTSTPEEFADQLKRDLQTAAKIVKAAGVQPE